MKREKFQFLVTVEIDKNIEAKYPNYRINWDSPEEFAESIMESLTSSADYDLTQKSSLKEYGYKVKAKKLKNKKNATIRSKK